MKLLARGAIATTPGTLAYRVPEGFKAIVQDILITNTTSSAKTVSVHFATGGSSVADANAILLSFNIPANDALSWQGNQVLNPIDFIQCIGSGSGLTMNISGDVSAKSRLDEITA